MACHLRPVVMAPQRKPRSQHGPSTPRLRSASPQVRPARCFVCSRSCWHGQQPPLSNPWPPLPNARCPLHTPYHRERAHAPCPRSSAGPPPCAALVRGSIQWEPHVHPSDARLGTGCMCRPPRAPGPLPRPGPNSFSVAPLQHCSQLRVSCVRLRPCRPIMRPTSQLAALPHPPLGLVPIRWQLA